MCYLIAIVIVSPLFFLAYVFVKAYLYDDFDVADYIYINEPYKK